MHGESVVRSRKRTKPPTSFLRQLLSAHTTSQIPDRFDQDSLKIKKWSRPLRTGSGSQTEIDVTYSKQTAERFLTGARMNISQSLFRRYFFARLPDLCSLQDSARLC
jgi:hypothetical protein